MKGYSKEGRETDDEAVEMGEEAYTMEGVSC